MEVDISGAKVFFTIPIDFPLFGKIQISETLVVSWIVMALITGLCIWLTRDLKIRNISKRQAVAEMIVETANKFVIGNMGEKFRYLIPFCVGAFRDQRCLEPDQPDRTSKSDSRSFHRGGLGCCGFHHDHHTEDQNQRFWRDI